MSDSQYVLKGLTEWRKGWERKGFRNAKGDPVANLALWKQLFALADARKVAVRWVRGHNGDLHNERVDGLANKALREAREGGVPKGGLLQARWRGRPGHITLTTGSLVGTAFGRTSTTFSMGVPGPCAVLSRQQSFKAAETARH